MSYPCQTFISYSAPPPGPLKNNRYELEIKVDERIEKCTIFLKQTDVVSAKCLKCAFISNLCLASGVAVQNKQEFVSRFGFLVRVPAIYRFARANGNLHVQTAYKSVRLHVIIPAFPFHTSFIYPPRCILSNQNESVQMYSHYLQSAENIVLFMFSCELQ